MVFFHDFYLPLFCVIEEYSGFSGYSGYSGSQDVMSSLSSQHVTMSVAMTTRQRPLTATSRARDLAVQKSKSQQTTGDTHTQSPDLNRAQLQITETQSHVSQLYRYHHLPKWRLIYQETFLS